MSCPSATKTKQENFELKLEQGNVNSQHILETLEDNELDKILEVLKSRKGTSENKIAFVLRNSSQFSNEKCESAVKQVKEYRLGLRQMMADGDFLRGTFFRVQRHIAWLVICKSWLKGCYIKIP